LRDDATRKKEKFLNLNSSGTPDARHTRAYLREVEFGERDEDCAASRDFARVHSLRPCRRPVAAIENDDMRRGCCDGASAADTGAA
jgi:hypothetical protein